MTFISYPKNKNPKTLIKYKNYSTLHEGLFEKLNLGKIIYLPTICTKYEEVFFHDKFFQVE